MSPWLKDALRTALDRDPIDILNELEMLRVLLTPRTDAMVRRRLGVFEPSMDDKAKRSPA